MADSTFSRTRRQLRIIAVQKWPQLEKKVKYDIYDLFSSLLRPPLIIETNLRIIKHPMYIYLSPGLPFVCIKEFIFVRKEIQINIIALTLTSLFFSPFFTICHVSRYIHLKSRQTFALLLWRALKNHYTNYHRFYKIAITQRIDG